VSLDPIVVLEDGRRLSFSFADMLNFHGGGSPGGVAHAFKVLERALPLVAGDRLAERREIVIDTSFGGPGARDGFELVTRAVSDGRFVLEPSLARPQHGTARERFVFRVSYRDQAVVLALRPGFVSDEFIEMAGREIADPEEAERFAAMKAEMSAVVMAAAAAQVYEPVADD
jgi:hypothetical protein